jgi:hypothetical protein
MNDNFVIENGVLISCEGTEITRIPEGVHTIKKDSISSNPYNAFNIKELYLPSTIDYNNVEYGYLECCHKLSKITMPSKLLKYDSKFSTEAHYKYSGTVNTSAIFFLFFGKGLPSDLKEIVVYGDEKDLDLSILDWGYLQRNQRNFTLRIENEVTYVKLGNELRRDTYTKEPIFPHIYINNHVENVVIDASEKWDRMSFIYRAPKANLSETTDKSVELTLAPREMSYNDKRWGCLIKINVSAITYLYPVELDCYETEKHQGCKLLLLGNRIEEIPLDNLNREAYPHVIVWEDYDTVYGKLKAKGWAL